MIRPSAPVLLSDPTTDRPSSHTVTQGVDRAIKAAHQYLLARQSPAGYWDADLIGDTTLESDAVMLMHFLGQVDPERQSKLLRWVLRQQNPDGGWSIFQGGPSELNATVKAYFALRLAGFTDGDSRLERARAKILRLGGTEACNSYTKFYLAMFGQYEWDDLPAMIPEILLLPEVSWGLHIYRVSAWTRTIVVPMLVLYALRPKVEIPFSIRDLRIPYENPRPKTWKQAFWSNGFHAMDRFFWLFDRIHFKPVRTMAMEKARRWMLERMRPPGGLGAIYPPMLNAILALRSLGYGLDSPELTKAISEFRSLEREEGDAIRVQPCFSAVWDTAWAVHALARGGCAETSAVRRGADWLLSKEIFAGGDWQVNNPDGEPAAWAFEFDNPYYPDTDDTAAVLMALWFAGRHQEPGFAKALRWLATMQNPDGGWGAFDRNVDLDVLNYLPWADHNALLDPSTVDLTGRIMELFGYLGWNSERPIVRRGVRFLKRSQESDGSWFGRWGVNYVYGTWQVLVGLRAIGQDMREDWVVRGADWLKRAQNSDGGWGETCRSYDDVSLKATGASTPSQTAWGVLGLLAAGTPLSHDSVRRSAEYLMRTQRDDGGWEEVEHTGTGFPRVFYLVYTLYPHYFPLLALQAVREAAKECVSPSH